MEGDDALPQRLNARVRKRQQREEQREEQEPGAGAEQPDGAPHDHGEDAGGGRRDAGFGAEAEAGADQRSNSPSGQEPDAGALPAYRSAAVGTFKFEYLDHTADVQLHAWGADLKEAFEQCGLAMFNYMSPLDHVVQRETRVYRAEGHDLPSLLYAFLDELLFLFATDLFLAASLTITSLDRQAFVIEAEGHGEVFERGRHEAGTEIKAVTYSAMAIREGEGDAEVFVIVDI